MLNDIVVTGFEVQKLGSFSGVKKDSYILLFVQLELWYPDLK
uniref:Uncharacterized protein n=1 Tax=Peronospora matthiolae TaxID=2874970 RepID=A0AAV1TN46_9STRA